MSESYASTKFEMGSPGPVDDGERPAILALRDRDVAEAIAAGSSETRAALEAAYGAGVLAQVNAAKTAAEAAAADVASFVHPVDAKRQGVLMAEAMRMLRRGEAIKLVIRGDSTTYGHDTVSADKVAADPTVLPDGSRHYATRSPKPYPAALQDFLNLGRGVTNVTVENQGYSGDWVKKGFERWSINAGAKITVISYGINDTDASYVPDDIRGDLGDYLDWTEKMIQRELGWGSAVVLMTPTRQLGQSGSINIDVYRNALQPLAMKYGIAIIDGEQFMATSPRDAWSDGNHLTTKGNAIMAARLAAVFFSESPLTPKLVTSGSKLLARPTADAFTRTSNTGLTNSTGFPTPADNITGQGTALSLLTPDGSALWSFYTDAPDMVVFPSAYINGGTGETGASLIFTLDFGVDPGDVYNDRLLDKATADFVSPANSVTFGPYTAGQSVYQATPKDAAPKVLYIPTAGWHTVRVTGAKSATSSLDVHNLAFYGYQAFRNLRDILAANSTAAAANTAAGNAVTAAGVRGSYHKAEPNSYNETVDILTTRVPWVDVVAAVYGIKNYSEYYKHCPMKLTVSSYGGAVLEYLLLVSYDTESGSSQADSGPVAVDAAGTAGGGKINFIKLLRTTLITPTPIGTSVNARVLESATFVGATRELVLKWKTTLDDGTTARNMKLNFNVLFSVV